MISSSTQSAREMADATNESPEQSEARARYQTRYTVGGATFKEFDGDQLRGAFIDGARWQQSRTGANREAVIRELCGDELNGGFIRDLCFTVWKICHEPKHEDGNADWGSDTLPTVQEAVKRIRANLEALATPAATVSRDREAENFALAANQCHAGYSTEYGDHRCRYQDAMHAAFMAMCEQRDNPDAEAFQAAIDGLGMAADRLATPAAVYAGAGEMREACAGILRGWLDQHGQNEIEYTKPREYAVDAINDCLDLIAALPVQGTQGEFASVVVLQARKPGMNDWTNIHPAQLSWMAKEGNEVRAVETPAPSEAIPVVSCGCFDETSRKFCLTKGTCTPIAEAQSVSTPLVLGGDDFQTKSHNKSSGHALSSETKSGGVA